MNIKNLENKKNEIIVTEKDLPLSCPIKPKWDDHPKVYLDIKEKRYAVCPYCGNKYKLSIDY